MNAVKTGRGCVRIALIVLAILGMVLVAVVAILLIASEQRSMSVSKGARVNVVPSETPDYQQTAEYLTSGMLTPSPTVAPTQDWVATITAVAQTSRPTALPTLAETARMSEDHSNDLLYNDQINEWQFVTENVPVSVAMDDVDYARGAFSSPWPALSNVLAEPGKLMVGPDFPQAQIDDAHGAIRRVDPGNQYRLLNNDYTNVGCEEGGFVFISTQYALVEFEDGMTFAFRAPDGSNTHVYIRCPALNISPGVDAGENIRFSQYRPGYGLVTHFSPEPPGGFVSADGASQALGISQSLDSCGGNGCLSTYIVSIDGNTGAYSTAHWDGERMEVLESNWYVAQ